MILTGKCKEAFNDFKSDDLESIILNSIRLDFFDSLGIHINIKSKFGQRKQRERFSYTLRHINSGFIFNSRQEAITEAIKSANGIYNNLKIKKK